MFDSSWLIFLAFPISDRYSDRALMKSEKRRGERTLPWATPVLKVILALTISVRGSRTVVTSCRDFRRSMSGIP